MSVESSVNSSIADQEEPVRALLQDALMLPAPLNTNIHKSDQMYNFITSARGSELIARSEYFTSGVYLLKIVEQLVLWKFGSFEGVRSFLDFASGYGRLTRFLVQDLPAERIWVSDIQAEAVAFQRSELGVHGFVSTLDPDALECDELFDCIFVVSLFSHLPPTTFVRWLKKLYSLLKPGGLLAFTVHDESGLAASEAMPDSGISFSEGSEIDSLDTQDYGRTIVTEAFVRRSITEATGRPVYRRIPFGMLLHQDIYLVANEPSSDFSGLHFSYLPHGAVDYALWRGPNELYVRGWAADMDEARPPVEVHIFVDGQLRQKCTPSIFRTDVREHFKDDRFLHAGWDCSCHFTDNDPTRLLTIKAISGSGVESLLYIGAIAPLLPAGKAELCLWIKPGELYVKGWAADASGYDSPVEVEISVNRQLRQRVKPSVYRPELYEHFQDDRFLRAGWECLCRLDESDPSQEIVVKSKSGGGESLLYRGTIGALEAQGDIAFGQLREALIRLQADLHRRLEYIRHLETEIAHKNEALANLETNERRWPWQRRPPLS